EKKGVKRSREAGKRKRLVENHQNASSQLRIPALRSGKVQFLGAHPMSDCLFCKFARKEIPTRVVLEDDSCLAFEDINPKAPVHILIIPKKHLGSLNDMASEDEALLGHLAFVAGRIAEEKKIDPSGYRAGITTGPH